MRRAIRIVITAVAIIGLGLVAAVSIGRYSFDRRVEGEVRAMYRGISVETEVLTEGDIAHLPEPVRRWLTYSGVIGRERPVTVRLRQEGEIRPGHNQDWMNFTADQYYTTDPAEFIWHINARMMSFVPVAGRDRLRDGHGHMEIQALSLIPVVDETGPEMDQGTLVRYLNEIMWFPAAAVSPYISWDEVAGNANAAKATMTIDGASVEATFYFDEQGRLTTMMAPRYQSAGAGEFRWLPWWTPVLEYGEFDGVRIPVYGEAY